MSKQVGNFYATETKKVLKSADTLYCMGEGETILLSNSYLLFKMKSFEYEMIARPITCRDAGNWTIKNGYVSDNVPDLFKLWNDFTEKADTMPCLDSTKFYYDNGGKAQERLYYCPDTMETMGFNSLYASTIAPRWMKGDGKAKFGVAYDGNFEPFAVLLPVVNADKKGIARAVRAFHIEDEATALQEQIAELKALLDKKTMEYDCQLALNRENVQRIKELENQIAIATPCVS